jgi:ribosome-associated translation inhibitor RaiA
MKIAKFEDFKFIIPEVKAEIVHYPKQGKFATIVNVPVKGKRTLRAEGIADDVLTSINLVTEKILDQLRRVKTSYEK